MSELNLSVKHHRTLEEARTKLEEAVRDVQTRFGTMIQRVDWSADHNAVTLTGTGFSGRVWVDPVEVHAIVDIPLLGQLFASPVVAGLKQIVQAHFAKQLPDK